MEDYINTHDEALEILADVANGDYKLENFRLDLQDFVQEREKERGRMLTFPLCSRSNFGSNAP